MFLTQRARLPWFHWVLGLLTIFTLISRTPAGQLVFNVDLRLAIVLIGLVVFVVNLEVPLRSGTLSLGYAAALLVYLIVGRTDTDFAVLVIVTIGGFGGGLLRAWRRFRQTQQLSWRLAEPPLVSASKLCLSMATGHLVYSAFGGQLPLHDLTLATLLPVVALAVVSMGVYMALYVILLWTQGFPPRGVVKENAPVMGLSLILPPPLIIADAILFSASPGGFVLLTIALLGLAMGATQLGLAQLRYQQQLLEMQSISAVSRAVRTNLNLESLAQMIYLQVATLLSPDLFILALHDPAQDKIGFPIAVRHGQHFQPPAPPRNSVIDYVIVSKSPLLLPDEPTRRAEALKLTPPEERLSSWLGVPLLGPDRAIGAIIIGTDHPQRHFTAHEQRVLSEVAVQSASAIENAQLYRQTDKALERRVQQLSALAAINEELSSTLTLNNVFTLVLERAIENTNSSGGVLLIRPETREALHSVVRKGCDTPDDILIRQEVVHDSYVNGKSSIKRGSLNQVAVPVIRDLDVLGVIVLESPQADAYPPEDIAFITQLATQATIAIDNVHLIEWMVESRNRLQVILDSMREAVIMFDLNGRIALTNPRVNELLSIDQTEIVGRKFQNLLTRPELMFAERLGFDQESLCALFDTLMRDKEVDSSRVSYQMAHPKQVFVDRTMAVIRDHNGMTIGLLMVFTDATEERELAQTREDISRMIVHDLRSPLTAISTSMKLLGEMATDDSPVARSIQRTTNVSQRALRKLLNLVDSLLDIAKMESGNINLDITHLPLRPIAEGVRIELSPLAEELNIRIDLIIPDDLPLLAIDGNKIERVLLNLVDNALKYSPVGGLIQIRAARHPEEGQRLCVEVIDNGPGIPDHYKERIFDRFQQLDNKSHRRGTGLGLTFCRLTVEAHGGKIWIADNPTGGSIFAFTLPTAGN